MIIKAIHSELSPWIKTFRKLWFETMAKYKNLLQGKSKAFEAHDTRTRWIISETYVTIKQERCVKIYFGFLLSCRLPKRGNKISKRTSQPFTMACFGIPAESPISLHVLNGRQCNATVLMLKSHVRVSHTIHQDLTSSTKTKILKLEIKFLKQSWRHISIKT